MTSHRKTLHIISSNRQSCRPEPYAHCPSLRTHNGFTLIEVLISLSLLIIVLGSVYSTFFSVQRAVERFDGVSLKYHEVRTALDIMRREIESSLLKNPEVEDDSILKASFIIEDRDVFGKSTSSLDLTAFSFRGSGLSTVSYFVKPVEKTLNLLKTEKPTSTKSEGYTMDIIEGIESFSIETLFNDRWVKTWDTKNTGELPDVVKISIEFDNNGQIVRLTEYARPKVGKQL